MNTKFLTLAKSFAAAIQDQIIYDQINDSIIFGQLLRTEEEFQSYLNRAMNEYFKLLSEKAQNNPMRMIIENPELLGYEDVTFPANTNNIVLQSKNIYKLLESGDAEPIDAAFIPEILRSDSYLRNKPVIAHSEGKLYYYPTKSGAYNFRLYFVKYPLCSNGTSFGFNSIEDVMFSLIKFQDIVALAVKFYKIDDYQEDV